MFLESCEPKAKVGESILSKFNISQLLYVGYLKIPDNFKRAMGHFNVKIHNYLSVTTYEIVQAKHVFLSVEAVKELQNRLTVGGINPADSVAAEKRAVEAKRLERHAIQLEKWRQEASEGKNLSQAL